MLKYPKIYIYYIVRLAIEAAFTTSIYLIAAVEGDDVADADGEVSVFALNAKLE